MFTKELLKDQMKTTTAGLYMVSIIMQRGKKLGL